MKLLDKYLGKSEFTSYEDFCENFSINIPDNFDFPREVVDFWGENEPEKLALLYCNDDGAEESFTFADISILSKKAATYFTQLGIGMGDRVLMLLRRRWEYWVCAVALHRIGAIVVPASIQLPTKDIAYRIDQSQACAVLAIDDEFVLEQIKPLTTKCPSLKTMILVGDEAPTAPEFHYFNGEYANCPPMETFPLLDNDNDFLIYFTSGTSGYPKMAIHNRTYPLAHITTARFMQCVSNNGLHLTQADSGWAKFGWGNIYGQWICGAAILGYDPIRFSGTNLLNVMERYAPTSICIPPTMFRFLLHAGMETRHVASINWFSTAGEPLSGDVNTAVHDISGHFIHEGYGQSEGTPITCSFEWFPSRPSSMGKPSPLYDVAIVNQEGEEVPSGDVGEVCIRVKAGKQLGLLSAYGLMGELQCPIKDGLYHTGDLAHKDEDGYFWYDGRNDDMIKCSGYRIGPFEIESVLNTHEAVKESAVVGRSDPIRGQVVCAVITLKTGYSPSVELTKELQSYVKQNTAPYKYPRIVEYLADLPKTTSGKIIRRHLTEKGGESA